MQAITFSQYGSPDVLRVSEIAKPVPKNKELLIKVYASTVSSGDSFARRGTPFSVRLLTGLMRPKVILGSDLLAKLRQWAKV